MATVVVTGFAELDSKLATLEAKLQRKLIRQALRKSGKRVIEDAKSIVRAEAHDTGAFEKSISVRAAKRSRKYIGIEVFVDANKLFAESIKASGGTKLTRRKEIIAAHRAERDAMEFYPAFIEFGYTRQDGTEQPPVRSQRRALYDNERVIKDNFISDLRELVATGK